jgi:hypothetical protein
VIVVSLNRLPVIEVLEFFHCLCEQKHIQQVSRPNCFTTRVDKTQVAGGRRKEPYQFYIAFCCSIESEFSEVEDYLRVDISCKLRLVVWN